MVIYFSLAICLLGLILYFAFNHPPTPPAPAPWWAASMAEIGRIMFFCGLLVFLLIYKPANTVGFLR